MDAAAKARSAQPRTVAKAPPTVTPCGKRREAGCRQCKSHQAFRKKGEAEKQPGRISRGISEALELPD